jgi:hypothetical protein
MEKGGKELNETEVWLQLNSSNDSLVSKERIRTIAAANLRNPAGLSQPFGPNGAEAHSTECIPTISWNLSEYWESWNF